MCPTDWGMTPAQAVEWVRNHMMKYYPLGVYKDTTQRSGAGDPKHDGKG
jgi:2-oxoglutarate/2-oxoacid ferredoxin oxidoreductase subunit beta